MDNNGTAVTIRCVACTEPIDAFAPAYDGPDGPRHVRCGEAPPTPEPVASEGAVEAAEEIDWEYESAEGCTRSLAAEIIERLAVQPARKYAEGRWVYYQDKCNDLRTERDDYKARAEELRERAGWANRYAAVLVLIESKAPEEWMKEIARAALKDGQAALEASKSNQKEK